jgi:hypothetical protein
MADNPGLFGIKSSNRDFTKSETWGKNQFNSSFPASLAAYIASKGLPLIYLELSDQLKVVKGTLSAELLFGIEPDSDDLYFAFEAQYSPYQQALIGGLPRVDLVTMKVSDGQALKPIEIKLTALPDNSTCDLDEKYYGCEIVVRPDTIVYLACSIALNFKDKPEELQKYFGKEFDEIADWTEGVNVIKKVKSMIEALDNLMKDNIELQEPLVMQPIWKTEGKSPRLADNCLDVFVWSNFAFTQLFINVARGELSAEKTITRQIRSIIWLFKMLHDYSKTGQIDHEKIIDSLSYNTKNDKAFSVSGRVTQPFMTCDELTKPRITKEEIKNIIVGGGQHLLSPERRFDAIIFNSPELFN